MKITSMGPIVVSPKADELIRVFEDLGFAREHQKSDIEGGKNINTVLKDSNGNRIDISTTEKLPKDLTAVRINVDNFEEAYEFLNDHGFVNTRGDKVTETSSSEDTFMMSPSGFGIVLSQHMK